MNSFGLKVSNTSDNHTMMIYSPPLSTYFIPIIVGLLVFIMIYFLFMLSNTLNSRNRKRIGEISYMRAFIIILIGGYFISFFYPWWSSMILYNLFYSDWNIVPFFVFIVLFIYFKQFKEHADNQQDENDAFFLLPPEINLRTTGEYIPSTCSECGRELENKSLFCHNCGTPKNTMIRYCSYCGSNVKNNAKYCQKCGNSLRKITSEGK